MKNSVLLIACLWLGCATQPTSAPPAQLDAAFVLPVGKQTVLRSAALTIKFDAVTNESRCPTGAMCGWEGNAAICLIVAQSGQTNSELKLNTNGRPDLPACAIYRGYRIQLLALAPYPSVSAWPKPADYRAKLLVTKKAAP